jgi:hypothetical protein
MPEKQKVITFGVPESLYNKINDSASLRGQKISDYMKKFVNDYYNDDVFCTRVVLDVPREKFGDKEYLKAWFKQKTDYLIDHFYDLYNDPPSPHNTPTAHQENG